MSTLQYVIPEKMIRNPITIKGQSVGLVTNNQNGMVQLFKTNPRHVFERIAVQYRFIDKENPGKSSLLFRQLESLLYECETAEGKADLYLTGNMLVTDDMCVVDAVEAFELIGKFCGIYFFDDNYGHRVAYHRIPIESLERESLLEEDPERWDTIEIITTEPEVIHRHLLFEECLHKIRAACKSLIP